MSDTAEVPTVVDVLAAEQKGSEKGKKHRGL
jgi:hypothetical protein